MDLWNCGYFLICVSLVFCLSLGLRLPGATSEGIEAPSENGRYPRRQGPGLPGVTSEATGATSEDGKPCKTSSGDTWGLPLRT